MLLEAYPVHESELEMLEVKNVDGLTPLLWAARHGRTDAARWCAREGADMLATDSKGRVARQVAHARGHKETAEALSALARTVDANLNADRDAMFADATRGSPMRREVRRCDARFADATRGSPTRREVRLAVRLRKT